MTPSLDDSPRLKKVVSELIQYVQRTNKEANPLIDANDETIALNYNLFKMPAATGRTKFIRAPLIKLPNPLFGATTNKTCCLLVRDAPKHDPSFWKRWHKDNPLPGLTKIMPVKKLKGKYRHFEGKRELCKRFDLFLTDATVADMMYDLLGSTFLKYAHKYPHTVKLGKKPNVETFKKHVSRAIESVQCRAPSSGSGSVKVGRCNMTADQIVENTKVVLKHLWGTIDSAYGLRSMYLRATDSPSLPIWELDEKDITVVDLKRRKAAPETPTTAPESESDSEEVPTVLPLLRKRPEIKTKEAPKKKKKPTSENKEGSKKKSTSETKEVKKVVTKETKEVTKKKKPKNITADTKEVTKKKPISSSTAETKEVTKKKPISSSTAETKDVTKKRPISSSTTETKEVMKKKRRKSET